MPKKPKTYSLPYSCTNCGHEYSHVLNKGTSAPEFATCPNCDTNMARPSHRIALMKNQGIKKGVSDIIVSEGEEIEEDEEDEEPETENLSAEEKAQKVRDALTEVHTQTKPENSDPTKKYILIGSNIQDKRKNTFYIRASDESWEAVKASFNGKQELQQFLSRIKLQPQSLVELYGVNPDECYFLEMLDRKWEWKKRMLPELPILPALMDGDYAGYRKSLGILD